MAYQKGEMEVGEGCSIRVLFRAAMLDKHLILHFFCLILGRRARAEINYHLLAFRSPGRTIEEL